jgi:hypothetical protein
MIDQWQSSKCQCQINAKVKSWILKSVQNDTVIVPNQVLNLIQDLRISASHLSFEFDLAFGF